MGVYSIGVVGESFHNDDGTSRQDEIRECAVGEPVRLIRDPNNPHDGNCVRVVSVRGVQIGNINAEQSWIAERIDAGRFVDAVIQSIKGGPRGKMGVVLYLRTIEKEPAFVAPPPSGCTAAMAGLMLVPIALAIIGLSLIVSACASAPPREVTAVNLYREAMNGPVDGPLRIFGLVDAASRSTTSGVVELDLDTGNDTFASATIEGDLPRKGAGIVIDCGAARLVGVSDRYLHLGSCERVEG